MPCRLSQADRFAINRKALQRALRDGVAMNEAVKEERQAHVLERVTMHEIERGARQAVKNRVADAYQPRGQWWKDQ